MDTDINAMEWMRGIVNTLPKETLDESTAENMEFSDALDAEMEKNGETGPFFCDDEGRPMDF